MKLYLLTRTDGWDYEEYNGAVIAAENPVDAEKIMRDLSKMSEMTLKWKCTLLSKTTEPEIMAGVILEDFNAA